MIVPANDSQRSLQEAQAALQFTVFTPTYNRAHTLHRVYDSLCEQTFRNFEWLVIDDGSTDGTAALIARWADIADFPIRYFRQENSGKHIAYNRAVATARGVLFAPLDSDDALLPDALERIAHYWNAIPEAERQGFSGIGGLCCDQNGRIIGDSFPTSPMDSDLREILFVYGLRGEKWGVSRTDVFRQFPFPEIAGTQFVPEGIVGLQMATVYKRRYYNEIFRIYYIDTSNTTDSLSSRVSLVKSAPGRLYYYIWLLNHDVGYILNAPVPFLKAAVMLFVVSQYSNQPFRTSWKQLTEYRAKLLVLAALPFSIAFYVYYRARGL